MSTRSRPVRTGILSILAVVICLVGLAPVSAPAATARSAPHSAAAAAGLSSHWPKAKSHSFSSPSKNIGCYVTRRYARCDIAHHTWQAPARPPWCNADWGNGLYVRARSHWVCAGDTVLGSNKVLPYGYYIRFGKMECISRRTGMKCLNLNTRHGFKLARESYIRF